MTIASVTVGQDIRFANDASFVLVGGMNVLEAEDVVLEVAERFVEVTTELGIPYVFKASFDKANRSSIHSFRGPGLDEGLQMLAEVKRRFRVPLLTDVHEPYQAAQVAEVVDILQVPAFLARQTDLLTAIARTGAAMNVKKPQFLAPHEMRHIINKCHESGNDRVILCERGVRTFDPATRNMFDLTAIPIVQQLSHLPIVADPSHGTGIRDKVLPMARAAVAAGANGVIVEVHPNPERALSDGAQSLYPEQFAQLVGELRAIAAAIGRTITPAPRTADAAAG